MGDGDKKEESETRIEGILLLKNDKCWEIEFLMSSKTKSGETSTKQIRMVRPVLLDIPKPFKNWFLQPHKLKKTSFRWRGNLP